MKNVKIAIDGPAGAGKSSVSKEVAKKLGCERFIVSGSIIQRSASKPSAMIPFSVSP